MPEKGITRRDIEQYQKEFRESAEGRWRAAALGTGAFTPYRCGDCGGPLSPEEEGWMQCNACIADDSESWDSGESEADSHGERALGSGRPAASQQSPQDEPVADGGTATDRSGDQTRAWGLATESVRSDHVTWRWCETTARLLGRSVSSSMYDIHLRLSWIGRGTDLPHPELAVLGRLGRESTRSLVIEVAAAISRRGWAHQLNGLREVSPAFLSFNRFPRRVSSSSSTFHHLLR